MSNELAAGHITPEDLAAYFAGRLQPDREDIIEEHFARCDHAPKGRKTVAPGVSRGKRGSHTTTIIEPRRGDRSLSSRFLPPLRGWEVVFRAWF